MPAVIGTMIEGEPMTRGDGAASAPRISISTQQQHHQQHHAPMRDGYPLITGPSVAVEYAGAARWRTITVFRLA